MSGIYHRDDIPDDLRAFFVRAEIGLEPTPGEFVAAMVEVFREVRRVLKDDGTLWLNLGDSYAGYHGNKNSEVPSSATNGWTNGTNENARRSTANRNGLKPKDLIGIPWMVAKALQAPYYSGRIKRVEDRIWLAAMIDGEGCMFIHRRKAGSGNHSSYTKKDGTVSRYDRTQDNYGAGLEVANTSLAIVERCKEITGVGSICRQDKDRRQPLYRWNLRSNECKWVVEEIYPHLVAKQHQARLLLGCPSSGPDAEAAHQGLIALHNGGTTHADFAAPRSLYEQGYYLRQDVIWSKLNPMPESVRDRCTKAHEYIFLMSKSERYFYDQDAILEESSPNTHARLSQDVQAQIGSARANGGTRADRPMNAVARKLPGNKTHKGTTAYEEGDERHRTKAGLVEYAERQRKMAAAGSGVKNNDSFDAAMAIMPAKRNKRSVWTIATAPFSEAHFATFPPELPELCIKAGSRAGDTILDPFGGAGTTGLVADRIGRNAILTELNPEYAAMARRRIEGDAPLLAQVTA